jgi:hypothetical protein
MFAPICGYDTIFGQFLKHFEETAEWVGVDV